MKNFLTNKSGVFKMPLFFSLIILFSCNKDPAKLTEREKLVAKGKAVYMGNCIACHNMNPKQAGSQGPDIYGSSLELITQRVLYAKYPPGYKPKRTTDIMIELPELEKEIPAIHAYLNN